MTQSSSSNSTQKVLKRKIIRKRVPITSDAGSESTTITRSNSEITDLPEKRPLSLGHIGLVHTQVRVAPLDKFSNSEYTGFVNLLILLFIVMMSRLVIENYQKYGNLIDPAAALLTAEETIFVSTAMALLMTHYAIGYWIELSRQRLQMISSSMRWHAFNALFIILEQTLYVGRYCTRPATGILLLLFSSILVLKLFSFAFVTTHDPKPVSLWSYIMFLFVPTLCFQYEYPKAPSRSWLTALRYFIEFVLAISSMTILSQQYAEPTLETSIALIKQGELSLGGLAERIMKLSLSVSLIWLAMFYGFFHAYLYFWAEVTQFGDRLFYKEWWNSSELGTYWRLWNQPVHQWLKRHVFIPMIQSQDSKYVDKDNKGTNKKAAVLNLNKFQAGLFVFLISAIFHEWIIAVPTGIYNMWAFWGIFGQVPLIILSSNFDNWYRSYWRPGYTGVNTTGNIFFWFIFCVFGQPMASYLYYRKWAINHNPELYRITREELEKYGNGNELAVTVLQFLIG